MLSVRRHQLPLAAPWRFAGGTIEHRELLLIEQDGCVGECAPLPGFSTESLDDCARALAPLLAEGEGELLLDPQRFADVRHTANWPPALQCALESLHLQLLGRRNTELPTEWTAPKHDRIALQTVIHDAEDARRAIAQGFTTLKVKIGLADRNQERRRLQQIREAVGPVTLRGDANRAWSLAEALHRLEDLAALDFALCEEPLTHPEPLAWTELTRVGVPLAADESARTADEVEALLTQGSVDAIVLKPMLIGGPLTSLNLARRAEAVGVLPILSSALETGVGLRACLEVARRLDGTTAHGLDTLRCFAIPPAAPFTIKGGRMSPTGVWGADEEAHA